MPDAPIPPAPGEYANIRDILGAVHGRTVIDITQHDAEEWREDGRAYVCFHFDNGVTLTFPISDDGFDLEIPDAPGTPQRYSPRG